MTTPELNRKNLLSLLELHCPLWLNCGESREKINTLTSASLKALYGMLAADFEKIATHSRRAGYGLDLLQFDFWLNKLASEILSSYHATQNLNLLGDCSCSSLAAGEFSVRGGGDEVVLEINKNGYCQSPISLHPDQLNDIYDALNEYKFGTKGPSPENMSGKDILMALATGKSPPVVDGDTYWLIEQDEVVKNPLFIKLAFNPYIISVVSGYLGCTPVHVQTNAWFSLPSARYKANLSSNAQMFHQDKEFVKFLKVFIYLTDVGVDQGPHCYVEASHLDELHKKGVDLSDRVADADIEKYYSSTRIKTVMGPAGMMVFGDTSCVHKGLPVLKGYRAMLQLEYASSLYLSPVKPFNDFPPEYRSLLDYPKHVADRLTQNYNTKHRLDFEEWDSAARKGGKMIWFKSMLRQLRRRVMLHLQ